MAYECPCCEAVVPDGEHLAHHLAIVSLTRGGEHEAWLDEHAEGWREAEPAAVAEVATEHADEIDHELVDEHGSRPETGHHHGSGAHGHQDVPGSPGGSGTTGPGGADSIDDDAAAALQEARAMTEAMLGEDADEADADASETDTDE